VAPLSFPSPFIIHIKDVFIKIKKENRDPTPYNISYINIFFINHKKEISILKTGIYI
jgi:hypothetical protein